MSIIKNTVRDGSKEGIIEAYHEIEGLKEYIAELEGSPTGKDE